MKLFIEISWPELITGLVMGFVICFVIMVIVGLIASRKDREVEKLREKANDLEKKQKVKLTILNEGREI